MTTQTTDSTSTEQQGYKYWIAYELRCLETDKRLIQNQTIFTARQIKNDEDINEIQIMINDTFNNNSKQLSFNATLTSWPHLMGKMKKPTKVANLPKPPTKTKPLLSLIVNNT